MLVKEIESLNFKDGQLPFPPRQPPPVPPPKSSKQPSSSTSTFKGPSVPTTPPPQPPSSNNNNNNKYGTTSPAFKPSTSHDSIDLPMNSQQHNIPPPSPLYDNMKPIPPKPAERKLTPPPLPSTTSTQNKSTENLANKKLEPANNNTTKNGGATEEPAKIEKRNIKRPPKMSDNEARRILGN